MAVKKYFASRQSYILEFLQEQEILLFSPLNQFL